MAKVKWGSISQSAIEEAEVSRAYTGKVPPAGVYRFKLRSLKKGTSNAGNPKLVVLGILDGSWKDEHKRYDGCPLWHHMPVTEESSRDVRSFCDALGVTAKDFVNRFDVDEDDNVLKIGKLVIHEEDLLIYVNVTRESSEEYGQQLKPKGFGSGYMPAPEDDDVAEDDSGDVDDDEWAND